MKSDLDKLMEKRGLDAIIVAGDEHGNPPRAYLSNGAAVTGGYVLKQRGSDPILVVNPMEIEEGAKSGLQTYSFNEFDWGALLKSLDGDIPKATVVFWKRMLQKIGLESGKVGVYGAGTINQYVDLVRMVGEQYPGYQLVGEMGMTLFDEAYVTKDADEINRIKSVAERTSAVLQATWDFIGEHQSEGEIVVKGDGSPLTIGDVKRFVRRELLDRDLEDDAMIFAEGHDGGVPHSRGEAEMPLKLGQAIVFDLFPREIGGGYYHDSTRTWSIGYAAPEVQEAYQQVMDAFDVAVDNFRVNAPAKIMQEAVQDYFESKGHPTTRSNPATQVGYVHSLGHGVGLNIHERPSIGHMSKDVLQAGNVISIEPGLYYPERGFGVRIEDLCYIDAGGNLVDLTTFHKDLVLPLRKSE
ncbi:MAG TPA: Xaa-Pro peptidase family protein [Phototrophicaceae bacterium]|nr:Xaa-Pro peptidase family protein [Phototrophicaceae bacterium]